MVRLDRDLAQIVPRFLENKQDDVRTMLEALEQADYESIRTVGHNLKGHGTVYGFDAISEIGRSIEQAAKDQDPEVIQKGVGELSTYLKRVEVVDEG